MTDEWTADEWNGSVRFGQSNLSYIFNHKSLFCIGHMDAKTAKFVKSVHRLICRTHTQAVSDTTQIYQSRVYEH